MSRVFLLESVANLKYLLFLITIGEGICYGQSSWTRINPNFNTPDFKSVAYKNGSFEVIDGRGFIQKSTNCSTWTNTSTDLLNFFYNI